LLLVRRVDCRAKTGAQGGMFTCNNPHLSQIVAVQTLLISNVKPTVPYNGVRADFDVAVGFSQWRYIRKNEVTLHSPTVIIRLGHCYSTF
jgi:hypothetical protein